MRQLATFLVIFSAFLSVQAQSETTPSPRCIQPKDEGTTSDGSFSIYLHYDHTQDKCFPFKFYGTGGNENRFEAEKYCMRNCSERASKLYPIDEKQKCRLKKEVGECMSQYVRYYYDSVHQKCKTFWWTGCVGNGNRFLDFQACNDTCYGMENTDLEDFDEEVEHDTPVALILGVVFGLIGAVILVAVIVLALKQGPPKKSKKASTEDAPMQEDHIEMRD